MPPVKVSVVIPAYNNAEYLDDAIQSVLAQTYANFELLIVDDASPQPLHEVVGKYTDTRIKYLIHAQNQGLSAARNTGIRASTGEIIALLDGDDYFHPEKFQKHVEYLRQHPDVGVTYNARFELNHSAKTVRELWRPPVKVGLADMVAGFPFSPSDMVCRREWVFRVNLFDVSHTYIGEDLDINCRLALEGCQFASVDRALNYRRYHSGRILKNLPSCVADTIRPLDKTFADQRCPPDVLARKDKALSMHYLLWSFIAYSQGETAFGQELCRKAVWLNPSFLEGHPCEFIEILTSFCIADASLDHEQLLRKIFEQLPPEVILSTIHYNWSLLTGYLMQGTRAILWDRIEEGRKHFAQAAAMQAKLDRYYSKWAVMQLLNFQAEFDAEAARNAFQDLFPFLKRIGNQSELRWLKGFYRVNQAFRDYRAGRYAVVPKELISATVNHPKYLTNRGVLSIFFRTLTGLRS
jgi:hypothetical protein